MRNLDVTTLRSFVAVAESGGVTRASGFLNLTQSAVSMQIKRLEEMLDLQLLERNGRGVSLTPSGSQLLSYAQKMVDLNDEIYSRLTDQAWEGEIVLGVPHDVVYPVIPKVLQRMGRTHPRVKVQLISSKTAQLKSQFSRGELDVILTTEDGTSPDAITLSESPLRWIGVPDGQAWKSKPLRLGFCRHCGFRPKALATLNDAGIAWEMAVESENDRTIEATVAADLAVTACLEGHAAPQLTYIDRDMLPDLGTQRINLYTGSLKSAPLQALVEELKTGFAANF